MPSRRLLLLRVSATPLRVGVAPLHVSAAPLRISAAPPTRDSPLLRISTAPLRELVSILRAHRPLGL